MRFISILFTIYIVWLLFKWLAKWALRYWMMKNHGKSFYYSTGFGGTKTQYNTPEGEIKVDSFGRKNSGSNPKSGTELGEYVDYEEVK